MKELTIPKRFLVTDNQHFVMSLQNWLYGQQLHGSLSRSRTKFCKMIDEHAAKIEEQYQEMLNGFVDKDAEGKRIGFDKDGNETTDEKHTVRPKISEENGKLFQEKYNELLKETFTLTFEKPADVQILQDIKTILDKTTYEFSGQLAVLYDEWCEAIETALTK